MESQNRFCKYVKFVLKLREALVQADCSLRGKTVDAIVLKVAWNAPPSMGWKEYETVNELETERPYYIIPILPAPNGHTKSKTTTNPTSD
ncbi:hypothetical protein V6N11_039847 [Hibiscus sabdariffa]|uniref:Uncharacterized protein n=1 Tax=Hibiscus sabdariffa TaxID=183260 RepID=A0ABR2RFY6_9ROSI